MALLADVVLANPQPLTHRHPDLFRHEIDTGYCLGHRMLDLEARIHLQEIESAVLAIDELDGAGVAIGGRAGDRGRRRADFVALGRLQRGRRRLLEDLLKAALH